MSPSQSQSVPESTQPHCPSCRRPIVDTDVGDVLSAVRKDLKHLLDLVTDVFDALREESDDDQQSES